MWTMWINLVKHNWSCSLNSKTMMPLHFCWVNELPHILKIPLDKMHVIMQDRGICWCFNSWTGVTQVQESSTVNHLLSQIFSIKHRIRSMKEYSSYEIELRIMNNPKSLSPSLLRMKTSNLQYKKSNQLFNSPQSKQSKSNSLILAPIRIFLYSCVKIIFTGKRGVIVYIQREIEIHCFQCKKNYK